ncbi:MAG: hypothetical protein ACOZAM_28215 [Pseudomonadota bacterium]
MNTHVEHRAIVRPTGIALLDRFTARICNLFRAWRVRQTESADIEALEALGPELLDDIGVTIRKGGKPPKSIAVCSPHLIATEALTNFKPTERGEF